MKKITTMILMLAMLSGLCACVGTQTPEETAPQTKAETAAET